MQLLIHWFISALALFIVSRILPGVVLEGFGAALIAVIIIGLVNALVKPFLFFFTLPINLLTLGLFTFVLNALMLMLAGNITPGFQIQGFGTAFLASILLTIVSAVLHSLVR